MGIVGKLTKSRDKDRRKCLYGGSTTGFHALPPGRFINFGFIYPKP